MTLRSHDCCPYLDDYEPDYVNQAAAAVSASAESKELTWDTEKAQVHSYSHSTRRRAGSPWKHVLKPHDEHKAPNREGVNAMWEGYTSDSTTDDETTADDGSEVSAEKCDPDWESAPTSADVSSEEEWQMYGKQTPYLLR